MTTEDSRKSSSPSRQSGKVLPPGERDVESDSRDWDLVIEETLENESMSADMRRDCVGALEYLQHELPPEACRILFDRYLCNHAQWTRALAFKLAETLARTENCSGYPTLIRGLSHADRFDEAMSVLDVAHHFLSPGLSVTFDPELPEGNTKCPDLLIVEERSGERLYVEVTAQNSPPGVQLSQQALLTVFLPVLCSRDPGIEYCAYLDQYPEGPAQEEFRSAVAECVESLSPDHPFASISIRDVLLLAVARPEASMQLKEWGAERGLKPNTISGSSVEVASNLRLSRRIRAKQEQLPRKYPGLIVVYRSAFDRHSGSTGESVDIMEILRQRSKAIGHVLGIAMPTEPLEGHDYVYVEKDSTTANLSHRHGGSVAFRLFHNPLYERAIPKRILARTRAYLFR